MRKRSVYTDNTACDITIRTGVEADGSLAVLSPTITTPIAELITESGD